MVDETMNKDDRAVLNIINEIQTNVIASKCKLFIKMLTFFIKNKLNKLE